jgi:hypothetical protein
MNDITELTNEDQILFSFNKYDTKDDYNKLIKAIERIGSKKIDYLMSPNSDIYIFIKDNVKFNLVFDLDYGIFLTIPDNKESNLEYGRTLINKVLSNL